MTLPAPNLDDRTFQDLVDDAKRFVQSRCPEWSDHNVSDPGVTLIETFAMVADQLIYRLNRVPELLYIRFLELLGVQLFPPSAARVPVTFWLSAPRAEAVVVPTDTEVATERAPDDPSEDPLVFGTAERFAIMPCSLAQIGTATPGGQFIERTDELAAGEVFSCFSRPPGPDDTMLIGLSNAVPSCAVALRFSCDVEGVGVDPRNPPLVWEAWTPHGWQRCDVDRDDTGGLNKPGDVVLHVPAGHAESVIGRRRAGWLRCRIIPAAPGQPFYTASPRVRAAEAFTVGGTTDAVYAERIRNETIGLSEGVPGQRFRLDYTPVASAEPVVVEVASGSGWDIWTTVDHFADSRADDRHVLLDAVLGEIVFGPAVRLSNGMVRQYGAVPPKGAPLRIPAYRTGGGRRGNVAPGTVKALRTSVPFIARIENRAPGGGGVDGETVENAKLRAPLLLRTRDRAVTAADYEYLATAASARVTRVRCLPGTDGVVRVLVAPHVQGDEVGRLDYARVKADDELLRTVTEFLDERRTLGARVLVTPPQFRAVTVVAELTAQDRHDPDRVREAALRALYGYLNPLAGGSEGTGWPFGRPVQVGELQARLQAVTGVDVVEVVRLFPADPAAASRGAAVDRVDLGPGALVLSYEHQVRVTRAGAR